MMNVRTGRMRPSNPRPLSRRCTIGAIALAMAVVPAIAAVPASGATPSAPKPSGKAILLGNVSSYSQPGFKGEPVAKDALQAWVKSVNAAGGINGHPVKVLIRDNKGDQALAVSEVKDLVENEGVVAFVSNQDGSLNAGYSDYLKEKGIPVLGGSVYTLDPWISNPMFFPQGLTAIPTITSIIDAVKTAGYKNIGSLACTAPQCTAANSLIENLAKKGGLKYGYGGTVDSNAPDNTATCLAAKNGGAQAIVLLIASADQGKKIADDCARQDYRPSWILPGEAISAGYLESKNFNKALNNSPVQPWFSKDPSMKEFNAAMKKYSPGVDLNKADLPLSAVDAWVAGLMLQRAVELSGTTGLPTTADLLAGLAKFQDERLGGMAGGLTFTDPTNKNQLCYFTIEIKNQKFTLPNGAQPPKCVASAAL